MKSIALTNIYTLNITFNLTDNLLEYRVSSTSLFVVLLVNERLQEVQTFPPSGGKDQGCLLKNGTSSFTTGPERDLLVHTLMDDTQNYCIPIITIVLLYYE